MHISLVGFVAGPNKEMNWIKVDEEIFDHVGKRISGVLIVPPDSYRDGGWITEHRTLQSGVGYDARFKVHPNHKQGL